MIKDVARQLQQDENVWCGEGINPRNLADCKQFLKDEERGELPAEYVALLYYVNGAFSDSSYLFGIMPESWPGLEDIVVQNEQYNSDYKSSLLFIGSNGFDWLVYDYATKEYQVRERHEMGIVEYFTDLEQALGYWFGLD